MRQCQDPRVLPALATAEGVAAGAAVAAAAARLALGAAATGEVDAGEVSELAARSAGLAEGREALAELFKKAGEP